MRRAHPRFPRWVARRTPLALLAALPVVIVGGAALGDTPPSYTGTATFVVPSGATAGGPGSSYEARSLALTYARLIPEDRSLLQVLARSIGTDARSLVGAVRATPVVDTALVRVSFRSPDLRRTEKVLAAAVGALTAKSSPTTAIPPGTLVLTSTSVDSAAAQGAGTTRALVAIAAVVLAAAVIVLAERTDPRIDAAEDLELPPGTAVLDLSRLAGSVARRILWSRAAREGIHEVLLVGADERHGESVAWCDERLRPEGSFATAEAMTGGIEVTSLRSLPQVPDTTDPLLGQVTDHDVALVVRTGTRRARVAEAVRTLTGAEARIRWVVFVPARLRRHAETGSAARLSLQPTAGEDEHRPAEGALVRGGR